MSRLSLSQLTACCPNLEYVIVSDGHICDVGTADNDTPLFQVAVIHKSSSRKTVLSCPLPEAAARTLCAKLTVYPWRLNVVEPAGV